MTRPGGAPIRRLGPADRCERGEDVEDNSVRIRPDPLRSEMQQQNAPGHEPIVPTHGPRPVIRGIVILARIHLTSHSAVRPPAIDDRDERAAVIESRVEHRHRHPGPLEQKPEIPFRHRPDPIPDLI
jgi:hypothetical protein